MLLVAAEATAFCRNLCVFSLTKLVPPSFVFEAVANLQERARLTVGGDPVNPIPRGAVRLDCVLGGEK